MFSPFLEKNPVVNLLHLGHRKPAARQAREAEFGLEQNLKKKRCWFHEALTVFSANLTPSGRQGGPKYRANLFKGNFSAPPAGPG